MIVLLYEFLCAVRGERKIGNLTRIVIRPGANSLGTVFKQSAFSYQQFISIKPFLRALASILFTLQTNEPSQLKNLIWNYWVCMFAKHKARDCSVNFICSCTQYVHPSPAGTIKFYVPRNTAAVIKFYSLMQLCRINFFLFRAQHNMWLLKLGKQRVKWVPTRLDIDTDLKSQVQKQIPLKIKL